MTLKSSLTAGIPLFCAVLITGQAAPGAGPNQATPVAPQQPSAPCQNAPCVQPLQTEAVPDQQPQEQTLVVPAPGVHDVGVPPNEATPGAPITPLEAPTDDIYTQVNLVADIPNAAQRSDPRLINPMGLAFGPTVPIRIVCNGTGVISSFGNDGQPFPSERQQLVNIPVPQRPRSGKPAAPTGVSFNETPEFIISSGIRRAPGRFLFATADGAIAGWSPEIDAHSATLPVDNSLQGVVYTGLAHGVATTGVYLYVANFRAGRIDVFDRNFRPTTVEGGFVDADIPAGYAPFNVQRIGEQIFVTYARQNPDIREPVAGPGNGIINVFDYQGRRVRRFASQGSLNIPWGMARAPDTGFGRFSGALLVANHGDGHIDAFNVDNGEYFGQLRAPDGNPIQIEGLWGLASRRIVDQPPAPLEGKNVVFFTAGPGQQMHGLFGRLEAGVVTAQTARR
jgi:uncharacterized protein (TIGR03118 family)